MSLALSVRLTKGYDMDSEKIVWRLNALMAAAVVAIGAHAYSVHTASTLRTLPPPERYQVEEWATPDVPTSIPATNETTTKAKPLASS